MSDQIMIDVILMFEELKTHHTINRAVLTIGTHDGKKRFLLTIQHWPSQEEETYQTNNQLALAARMARLLVDTYGFNELAKWADQLQEKDPLLGAFLRSIRWHYSPDCKTDILLDPQG